MEEIKVAIIEDNKTINQSLTAAIEMQVLMSVSFNAFSVEEGIKHLESGKKPNILLLDIGLPGMTGIEGIPKLKALLPDLDIIMLSTYDESEKIFGALCAGACSYLSKKTSLKVIMESIHTVARGGSFMSPSIARKIANHFQPKSNPISITDLSEKLTKKQLDIVQDLSAGLSYQQISDKNFVSINTIRSHIKKVYQALQVHSKVELLNLINKS